MDLMLILLYTGLCVAIFKIFKVPLNKWTVPTAILGGIAFIASLMLTMNVSHPYGKYAQEYFVSIPIVPPVSGVVVEVPVEPNVPLEAGAVLFRIDPRPYQLEVDRLRAKLADAEQVVRETAAALEAAGARVAKERADRDRVKASYERVAGASQQAVTQQERDTRRMLTVAAEAALDAAEAEERRIRLIYESRVGGVNTRVAELQAQLSAAEYDLERTVVRAPADGMVTQMLLRPGAMASNLNLRPTMVFIPAQRRKIAASFFQNSLRKLEAGAHAEVALDALPGKILQGKVTQVLPYVPESEVQFGGTMLSAEILKANGRAIAIIELEEDLNDYGLPNGVRGKAAVFSSNDPMHVSAVRKILLRMLAWTNYVYPIK